MWRLLLVLMAASWASVAPASDLKLALVAAPPALEGHSRVQVSVHSERVSRALSRGAAFKVVATHGEATVADAHTVAQSGERVYTVLAFDQSGSFRTWWDASFELAEGFADQLPADGSHSVEVVTFGVQLKQHGSASRGRDVRRLLTVAHGEGATQGYTRLRNFTRDSAGLAEAGLPSARGGLRQVIVFTDAGEESVAYDIAEVIEHARDLSVRVHVVAFSKGSGQSDTFAQRLDEVRQIAESTGGRFIQVGQGGDGRAEVAEIAEAATRVYWLELDWCGVSNSTGVHFRDEVSAEVWNNHGRLASTGGFPFRQHAAGDGLTPCGPVAIAEHQETSGGKIGWFWWLAGSGLGLLGLLGLALVMSALWTLARRKPREETPSPPPEPEPAVASALLDGWRDPFIQLPETHLVRVSGPTSVPERVRIHRSEVWVGGEDQADVVLKVAEVSGRHLRLQLYEAGAVFVTDEGSTNGTWIEGVRLAAGERRGLLVGQLLSVSRQVVFRLEQPGHPSAKATGALAGESELEVPSSAKGPKKTIYDPVQPHHPKED